MNENAEDPNKAINEVNEEATLDTPVRESLYTRSTRDWKYINNKNYGSTGNKKTTHKQFSHMSKKIMKKMTKGYNKNKNED